MEENVCELKIRKVNNRQFDVVMMGPGRVMVKHNMSYDDVHAFLWALYGQKMYKCDSGKSVCSTISVKF